MLTSPAFGNINTALSQARCCVDTAYSKLQNAESYVESIENSLQIEEWWTMASLEYKMFYQENVVTSYERALDELERLIVMRLFELTKMSTSGTGKLFLFTLKISEQIGQVTSFAARLGRPSSDDPKPSGMPSIVTTPRWPSSLPHIHCCPRRKLLNIASLLSLMCCDTPPEGYRINHGHRQSVMKEW